MQKQPSRGVLGKGVLKICSKFAEEHPCRIVISIRLQSNFITGEHPCRSVISIKLLEITLRHGCSVNLLHMFRTSFLKNTFGGLLLEIFRSYFISAHLRNLFSKMFWIFRVLMPFNWYYIFNLYKKYLLTDFVLSVTWQKSKVKKMIYVLQLPSRFSLRNPFSSICFE